MKKTISLVLSALMLWAMAFSSAVPVLAEEEPEGGDEEVPAEIEEDPADPEETADPEEVPEETADPEETAEPEESTDPEETAEPEEEASEEEAEEESADLETEEVESDDAHDLKYGYWNYQYRSDRTIEITAYTGSEEYVSVPSEIFWTKVTKIKDGVFSSNSSIKTVDIPSGVITIGDSEFADCENLTTVKMGGTVTSIGNDAFKNCAALESVTLSSGLSAISENMFYGCAKLSAVEIPSAVTSIGNNAFYGSGLTSITIPDSVLSIGNNAFEDCYSLASAVLPADLSSIGTNTFYNCSALISIVIPSEVTAIGDSAFSRCTSLASVSLPEGLSSIGHQAFDGCSSLTSVTIPDAVTSIAKGAFQGCSSLKTAVLPTGLTAIEENTFADCSALESIDIPASVTSIGAYAFSGCSALKSVSLPENLTSIGECAFQVCSQLPYIVISANVTEIGNGAFSSCSALTIYGYTGSYAETYANANSIPFSSLYGKITYYLNKGTNDEANPDTYAGFLGVVELKDAKRDGYTFAGWYLDSDYKTAITEVGTGDMSGDISLYAKWASTVYTITYVLNDGVNSAENPSIYKVWTPTITLADPTRDGVAFLGWYSDSTYTDQVCEITKGSTGNLTLYAKWDLATYEVRYKKNGGKGVQPKDVVAVDTNYTIRDNMFVRVGYTFVTWNLNADGSHAKDFQPGSVWENIKKAGQIVPLYAQWQANTYTIRFNRNGGTGTMADQKDLSYDSSYTLNKNAFTKEGYKFVGWNTKKDGSGTAYKNKAEIENLTAMNGKIVTLYAQWKAVE